MTELVVTWEHIQRDSRALARRIAEKVPRLRGLLAVARGGLVPAAIIANEISLRTVLAVSVVAYHDRERGAREPIVIMPPAIGDGDGFVIVDDLVDSGATARALKGRYPRATYAVLYAKPQGEAEADLVEVACLPQTTWLVFPWEGRPPADGRYVQHPLAVEPVGSSWSPSASCPA